MEFILNADDFGRTETVNTAITEGFRLGKLSRTSIMVNKPCFYSAVALARQNGFADKVCLHINLSSGFPLTDGMKKCRAFTDENGRYHGKIFKDKKMQFYLDADSRRCVYDEVDAQIKKFVAAGFTQRHADSHGYVHTFVSVLDTVLRALKDNSFTSVRISRNLELSGPVVLYKKYVNSRLNAFNKKYSQPCDWFDSYVCVVKHIDELLDKPGVCEIMLHPNIFNDDMHTGDGVHYDDIDADILGNMKKI